MDVAATPTSDSHISFSKQTSKILFFWLGDLLLAQVPEKILKMTMSLSLNLGTYSNSIQDPYEVWSVLNNKS